MDGMRKTAEERGALSDGGNALGAEKICAGGQNNSARIVLALVSACELDGIYAAMKAFFPPDELREESDVARLLNTNNYFLYHIEEFGKKIGFISVWKTAFGAFVEHFAIFPEFRGNGAGGRAIELVKGAFGRVILEVERPHDDISERRIAFYVRHGFVLSLRDYMQPPYRQGGSPVPMYLMSYPAPPEDFEGCVRELRAVVYGLK